jgi:hypothetical protein
LPPLLSVVSRAGNAVKQKPVDLCISELHHLICTTETEGTIVRARIASTRQQHAMPCYAGANPRLGQVAAV